MKLELEIGSPSPESDKEAHRDLNGLHVYASSFCPRHGVGLIVVRPTDREVDKKCLSGALMEMYESVLLMLELEAGGN